MARKIIWSHEATEDLDAVAQYIAKDSPYYASAFVQDIMETSRSLEIFSAQGRIVPELGKQTIRELIIRNYRLIYKIEESHLVVLALIHGSRDLRKILDKEKRI